MRRVERNGPCRVLFTSQAGKLDQAVTRVSRAGDRLSALPDDLLAHVLTFLDFRSVCTKVAPVSQRLHRAGTDARFTNTVQSLVLTGADLRRLPRPAFCRLFSRLGRLTDLVFTGCGSVIDDAFLVDLSACVSRRLKRFEVDWCGSVSDVGVRAVASACPQLVHFTLFKGRCRSAQRDGVTDRALRTISVKCPRLETLCLTYAHITQKGKRGLGVPPHPIGQPFPL